MRRTEVARGLTHACRRIFAVAKWTLFEALHFRVGAMAALGVLTLGMLALTLRRLQLGSAELTLLKDLGSGVASVLAIGMACLFSAQVVFDDTQSGFLATLVTRALGRAEYLVGRFVGLAVVLLGVAILMTTATLALVMARSHELGVPSPEPVPWLQVGLIVWVKATVVTALSLAVASYAGSLSFCVVISLTFTGLAHARSLLENTGWGWLTLALPDLARFDPAAPFSLQALPWSEVLWLCSYGGTCALFLLVAAATLFQRREF